jgi:hypothetical protein
LEQVAIGEALAAKGKRAKQAAFSCERAVFCYSVRCV